MQRQISWRGQIDVADIGEGGLHHTAEIERLNVGVFVEGIFRYICCRMRIVNGKEGRGYFASKPKNGGLRDCSVRSCAYGTRLSKMK